MKNINELLKGYERTEHYHYSELKEDFPGSVYFDELPQTDIGGVLKINRYVNGRLLQTYSDKENHVGVVAATRLGKTTSYVIPTVVSFAKAKAKRSLIISDPKGEIYRHTAKTLKNEGYKVFLLNFRDYLHSECWNPLTPIFRKYQKIFSLYDEVTAVKTDGEWKNCFRGKIYENHHELNKKLQRLVNIMTEDVGNDIDKIAGIIMPTPRDVRDPFWYDSARELLKAYLWGMLEDSRPETLGGSGRTLITEDTYSFSTVISLIGLMNNSEDNYDGGYFTRRNSSSRALQMAKSILPETAKVTRQGIICTFNGQIAIFRESAARIVTSCNSFDVYEALTGDKPVAIFIDYRDELKVHYKIISLFIQDAYRILIEHATMQSDGKRKVPFYFILDEFGNFPKMTDFETTISACGGRNIFFILIMQSYAQLNSVYGDAVAAIIRDNLNMHIFFGSNNFQTLEEFSKECGLITRISPTSALNGRSPEIDCYQVETIPLVPKSDLSHLDTGECIVTEANCGYVLFSKMERYYLCPEFNGLPLSDENQYVGGADPFDTCYTYKMQ